MPPMDMDVDESGGKYVLREELRGHSAAVRSLCMGSSGELITGGADAVVNRWDIASTGTTGSPQAAPIFDHEHNVLALMDLPSGRLDECPTGGFVSGSQDRMLRVFNSEGTLVRQLAGHEHGVISLSWSASGELLSGSWDGSAKVWTLGAGESTCTATLGGHENGVCVLGMPNGDVATGSTGKQENGGPVQGFQIRIWRNGSVVATVKDHSGPVRSLAMAPGLGFLSTSNDGTVVLRDFSGAPLVVMQHPHLGNGENFVYCGASSSSSSSSSSASQIQPEYLSCSEDATVAVWKGGQAVDVIQHPDSVWAVCALPNGDIATGCNDGVVRLFTRELQRAADPQAQANYSEQVAEATAKKRGGPSAAEIAKLDKWEARQSCVGRGEGDVRVFNKGGVAVAAQWSAAMSDWVEVGEVLGSRDSGTIDGVRYDHVIPVEFEQPGMGMVKLQIGHNDGDNPYTTAQLFIAKHGLDPDFLEKIASHIRSHAGNAGPTIGMGDGNGSERSQFTNDPATSSDLQSRKASLSSSSGAPRLQYCTFEKPMAMEKIQAKIVEFSSVLKESGHAAAMADGDALVLSNLCTTLARTNRWHTSTVSDEEVRLVVKLVKTWPNGQIFPVLDLLRVAMLHPDWANKITEPRNIDAIFGSITDSRDKSSDQTSGALIDVMRRAADLGDASVPMAMQLVALRCACNCFAHATSTRRVIVRNPAHAQAMLNAAAALVTSLTKNVRIAAASFLFNYATALGEPGITAGGAADEEGLSIVFIAAGDAASATAAGASANSDDASLQRALLAAKLCLEHEAKTSSSSSSSSSALVGPLGRLGNGSAGPKSAEVVQVLLKMLA